MKSLDLNLLIALDALLTAGSVSGAAHRMHLSTPAMSHTLARIRKALGDPILVRAGRRLVPTPRALELREPVRRLIDQARALISPVDDSASLTQLRRDFVVRAPDGIAIIRGAMLLEALNRGMPLATLRFVPDTDGDLHALRDGRIDLDIGTIADCGTDIHTLMLHEQRTVCAVKAGHELLRSHITPATFADQPHVAIARRGNGRDPIDLALSELGLARRVVLTVPSAYGALMAAARSADLVACAPEQLARSVAPGLGLQIVDLPVGVPAEEVVQAWHPRVHADAAHRYLRQCVGLLSAHAMQATRTLRDGTAVVSHGALLDLASGRKP
ncbi:LysR family transcriptional regulator [Piscinibacter terrae]|uniref:LysR family transcriptional regulator n=1 Tax=Piscinibacter terrae TaxID=2496871 RepID=A0A3N7IW60_9BURK|nr:LysR family transcriptional regulator [Albitalea terrae]RQP23002.1 LysR family transcriptional regulator [Albitalea terrae]